HISVPAHLVSTNLSTSVTPPGMDTSNVLAVLRVKPLELDGCNYQRFAVSALSLMSPGPDYCEVVSDRGT
ncbi:MAG: hypothetical protein ACP5O0_10750, partial [Acidimicrobiales bacterium]